MSLGSRAGGQGLGQPLPLCKEAYGFLGPFQLKGHLLPPPLEERVPTLLVTTRRAVWSLAQRQDEDGQNLPATSVQDPSWANSHRAHSHQTGLYSTKGEPEE